MSPCRLTPLYHLGPMRVMCTSWKPALVNHSMYSSSVGNSIHASAKNLEGNKGRQQQSWRLALINCGNLQNQGHNTGKNGEKEAAFCVAASHGCAETQEAASFSPFSALLKFCAFERRMECSHVGGKEADNRKQPCSLACHTSLGAALCAVVAPAVMCEGYNPPLAAFTAS